MGGALQAAHGRLGMKLRLTRSRLGMTQMAVARATGMDQTTVSSVERGMGDDTSKKKINEWLANPEAIVEHVSDAILQAAVATGDTIKRRELVKAWVNLYGEDGDNE